MLGAHAHPEISMHTPSLAEYVDCLERQDVAGIGKLMLRSANKLASIGADFLICPDNTIHRAFAHVAPYSPLPWLHIAEVVALDAVEQGFSRLGLLGTKWLVDSEVYPEKLSAHALECVIPDPAECENISRIIMDELVYGIFMPEAVTYIQHSIERLRQGGCDAVILGCTEIPLIIDNTNSALPTLDSTRLLAQAALQKAVSD